jgi:hypothetical protein
MNLGEKCIRIGMGSVCLIKENFQKLVRSGFSLKGGCDGKSYKLQCKLSCTACVIISPSSVDLEKAEQYTWYQYRFSDIRNQGQKVKGDWVNRNDFLVGVVTMF